MKVHNIEVKDPQMRENTLTTFTVFKVILEDSEGIFEVYRRFSDFIALREALVNRWPGCYVPPIPDKQTFGNKDDNFIEDRRQFLQYFCKKLSEIKYLFFGEEGKIFFKSKSDNFEAQLNQLPKITISQIVLQYKHTFRYLSGKEINTELILNINGFKNYLEKQSKTQLESLRNFTNNLKDTQISLNQQINQMNNELIQNYEQVCFEQFLDEQQKQILLFSKGSVKQQAQELKNQTKEINSFEVFNDFVKYEHKEVAAFLEAFKEKEKYELLKEKTQNKIKQYQQEIAKLLQNKTSLKSIFKSGTKEDQMQKAEAQIKILEEELQDIQILIDLITLILGYVEINKFKESKAKKYFEVIEKVSELEVQYQNQNQNLWKAVISEQDTFIQQQLSNVSHIKY